MNKFTDGFTLVEMTIAMTVLSILFYALFESMKISDSEYRDQTTQLEVSNGAKKIVQMIADELQNSSLTQITSPLPLFPAFANSITFSVNAGYAGAIIWSAPITYQLTMDEGELQNGIDDNGDGRIDEQLMTRTQNADQIKVAGNIKFQSLQFSLTSNNAVRISVTVEKPRDSKTYTDETYSSTAVLNVRPRN